MRKFLITTFKFMLFFIGWALCASFDISFNNPVLWRLMAETLPLLVLVAFSVLFWVIEKRKFPIAQLEHPVKNVVGGAVVGSIWLGIVVAILWLTHTISFIGMNPVSYLGIWLLSCLINVVMQELLVRGYLYQLIKTNYSTLAAAVVTTILFTSLHGGAFEAGLVPVLNVMTMSIFMTLTLEYTHCIAFPIMIHFIWNGIGAIILGGVSLASDYPSLLQISYSGHQLLNGGACKIEGSIIVLILNVLFIALFSVLMRRQKRRAITTNN